MNINVVNSTSYSRWADILTQETCIYIYTAIICTLIFSAFTRCFFFYIACAKASMTLHDNMFIGLTRATMRFFYKNASGRILNRFSKDIGALDTILPMAFLDCIFVSKNYFFFNLLEFNIYVKVNLSSLFAISFL